MRELTNQKKLELIIDLCKKNDITAYEIAKETDLNASGLHRIFTKEVKTPRGKTLNKILEFLELRLPGRNIYGHKNYVPKEDTAQVKEDPIKYNTGTQEILGAIEKLRIILEYRTDVISTTVANTMLNTDEILKDVKGLNTPIQRLIDLNESRG